MILPLERINLRSELTAAWNPGENIGKIHRRALTSSVGLLNAPMSNLDPPDEMWASENTEEENASVKDTQWAQLVPSDSFFPRADGKWQRRLGQKEKTV